VEREIDIPVEDEDLTGAELFKLAYQYGQNDFQPREACSVSVGDIIYVEGQGAVLVQSAGFSRPLYWFEIDDLKEKVLKRGDGRDMYFLADGY
jgi:hypothetical protein